MATTSQTRTAEVYEVLRTDLLTGALSPGQRLPVVDLALRFGVSQSVIREALTRLGEQALVVALPQRGFRVRDISVKDIAELTEARVLVETKALELAIERGDVQWEAAVLTAHHVLDRTAVTDADGKLNQEWARLHRDFHRSLLSGCNNARLEGVAGALREGSELYRVWYWLLADDHQRDLAAEHRRLSELAVARDAAAAVALLTEHIRRAPCMLIEYAEKHGADNMHGPAPTA